jgi:hypothetical protein
MIANIPWNRAKDVALIGKPGARGWSPSSPPTPCRNIEPRPPMKGLPKPTSKARLYPSTTQRTPMSPIRKKLIIMQFSTFLERVNPP